MEIYLFLYLLLQLLGLTLTQTQSDVPPDVEVLSFSWSHNPVRAADASRTGRANPGLRQREFRREMENRNSIENRSRDMRELEESVAREAWNSRPVDTYKYRIELRNSGTKVIKWIFLDYQISEPSDPENPSHRQFACAVKIKPHERKSVEAFSILPPSRVISASDKPLTERLVINRIEYNDGIIWQRPNWHAPDKIPSRSPRGPCRPF